MLRDDEGEGTGSFLRKCENPSTVEAPEKPDRDPGGGDIFVLEPRIDDGIEGSAVIFEDAESLSPSLPIRLYGRLEFLDRGVVAVPVRRLSGLVVEDDASEEIFCFPPKESLAIGDPTPDNVGVLVKWVRHD